MRPIITIFAFVCALPAFAQDDALPVAVQNDPVIEIIGPDPKLSRSVGQACVFPVKGIPKGSEYEMFIVPEGQGELWDLMTKNGDPFGLFIPSLQGQYTCVVVALIDGKMVKDLHSFPVGKPVPPGPDPGPDPDPDPGPNPNPDVPLGFLGFTKFAHDEARKLPQSSWKTADKLVVTYAAVADYIRKGKILTIDQAIAAIAAANNAALTAAEKTAWKPWFDAQTPKWNAEWQNGGLQSVVDYATAFDSVADGLALVNKQTLRR